jgi:hypothetical protein
MNRRNWLVTAIGSAVAAWLVATRPALAEPEGKEITLEDRLKAGLKCRRPEEFAFVKTVAQKVDQKQLTPDLVLSTYRWAVEQRPEFPFYYFQYGLRRRASAIGVSL